MMEDQAQVQAKVSDEDVFEEISTLETENESLRADVEALQRQVETERRHRERLARVIGDVQIALGVTGVEPESLVEHARKAVLSAGGRRRLPTDREAVTKTFRILWTDSDGVARKCKVYATAGLYEDATLGELFIRVGEGHGTTLSGFADAFSIACSLALQHGCPVASLVAKFRRMRFPPDGAISDEGQYRQVSSIVDAVFGWVEKKFCVGSAA